MRPMMIARSLILLTASLIAQPALSVDCSTAQGQFALMSARVLVGEPQDPSDLPPSTSLPFRATSELFLRAQDETSNQNCMRFLKAWLYVSASSSAIDSLSTIAANATSDLWLLPRGVFAVPVTITRSGNVLTFNAVMSRGSIATGTLLHYRFAKQIIKEGAVDPYVWSSRFGFKVPAAPVAPALPNLIPQPTRSSNVNRPRFAVSGSSFGVDGETFLRVPDLFCANILTNGTTRGTYRCGTSGTCRKMSMSVALPPVVYFARNIGQAAADTSSGLFEVKLQRSEMVNGVSNKLTTVSSGLSKRVEPGANSPQFSFNPGRSVTVYAFPDDNPGSCFDRCDPNQGGCVVPYQELEYKVLVDGGNATQGEVLESNEADDEGDPMGPQQF